MELMTIVSNALGKHTQEREQELSSRSAAQDLLEKNVSKEVCFWL